MVRFLHWHWSKKENRFCYYYCYYYLWCKTCTTNLDCTHTHFLEETAPFLVQELHVRVFVCACVCICVCMHESFVFVFGVYSCGQMHLWHHYFIAFPIRQDIAELLKAYKLCLSHVYVRPRIQQKVDRIQLKAIADIH